MFDWNQTTVWLVTTTIFFLLLPVWIKKRSYFIIAGILFFTPTFIFYESLTNYLAIWPLISSIPGYLMMMPDSWLLFVTYVIPAAFAVGIVFYAIAAWRKI